MFRTVIVSFVAMKLLAELHLLDARAPILPMLPCLPGSLCHYSEKNDPIRSKKREEVRIRQCL